MILLKFQKNMKYNKLSKKKLSLDFTMLNEWKVLKLI